MSVMFLDDMPLQAVLPGLKMGAENFMGFHSQSLCGFNEDGHVSSGGTLRQGLRS